MKQGKAGFYLLAGIILSGCLCSPGNVLGRRAASAPQLVELQIDSEPAGAEVMLDRSVRGHTPLTLQGLAEGEYLIHMQLADHREWIGSVVLTEGGKKEVRAVMEPLRGTALVTSEPGGAQVKLDGVLRGMTPLLLSDLPLGQQRVELSMPGYQSCLLDLDVKNQSPQKLGARLITDSATLRVESEPAGARLNVNGVPRGTTPVVLERIPDGDAEIEIQLEGYATYRQSMRLSAGDEERLEVILQPLPATLQIHSMPPGARVYLENEYRGDTPLTLEDLAPESYRVRVELAAHDPMARTVTLGRGARQVEEFRLTANCGSLRVVTIPAGVTVLVDGRVSGTTEAKPDATDQISDPLTIPMVVAGEREVTFTRQGFFETKRTVNVARDRTETLEITLRRRFIPDYEVRTESNVYRGVLINITAEFLRLETEIGVIRAFPITDIKSRRPLREDEVVSVTPAQEE